MKISLNSIKALNERYGCAGDVTAIGIDKLIAKIGAQLGAVEEVIDIGGKYQGIIIVKVVSCDKHPNADKLSVCKLDDGRAAAGVERDGDGYVQVVCGAPNVRQGLLAAWLPPGSTVPSTAGTDQPFALEARELRGIVSNGMLASPKELALGDSHAGLLEIDGDYQPGTDFAQAFGLKDDLVLDIENKMFTHRPDCFGFMGIARELAGIQNLPYKSPRWYVPDPTFPEVEAEELSLKVINELPELVPRFTAITMRDVKVGPSPVWLQVELAKVGQKSINNIVDYANFFMMETGQPLHAFDYDKVKALSGDTATLVVRNPKPGETIKLLNGKEIEPRAEAIMIATDRQLISLAGVMGGSETEVDETTNNLILEVANFDMYSIRRTAMEHGIFTDAVTRFTKGQSPLQNQPVIAKIVDEIRREAGGQVAGSLIDDNHLGRAVMERNSIHLPIKISADFINGRLGLKLSVKEIKKLLENVEFDAQATDDEITVQAPFWRTDIELREDVVEEVGRLYGYDHLPLELPQRDLTPTAKAPLLELKDQVRNRLSRAGANEVLTYSFVHGDLLNKAGQDKTQAFQLSNALSPDLQYYRLSLTPSLLAKVHPNIKAGYQEFALFELGKTHDVTALDGDGIPSEFDNLALVYADRRTDQPGAAYYQARQFVIDLAAGLGYELDFVPLADHAHQTDQPFEPDRSAVIRLKGSSQDFGVIGEFSASARQSLKLPERTAGFEVGLGAFMDTEVRSRRYVPLSRFPKVTQDITLRVPAGLNYQALLEAVTDEVNGLKPEDSLVELGPVDIYQAENDQQHRHVTLRLTIANYQRTLTDAEVAKLLDAAAETIKSKLDAERV